MGRSRQGPSGFATIESCRDLQLTRKAPLRGRMTGLLRPSGAGSGSTASLPESEYPVARPDRAIGEANLAPDLSDLRVPPGNRLEKLGGDRRGQYSIRINDQWRICFRWQDDGPWDVESSTTIEERA